jgi:hypothetical protein
MTDDTMTGAFLEVAKSIDRLARAVRDLGNGDAATPMGAIEAFGAHIGEKMDAAAMLIADALSSPREG